MDDYEDAEQGFRGLARRKGAHEPFAGGDESGTDPAAGEVAARPRPVRRFPIPGYGDPTDSLLAPMMPGRGGEVEMPHWSAPPTGEVPRIIPTRRDGEPEPPAGAVVGGLGGQGAVGWRDREADWDDPDYEPARLGGLGGALGALDEDRGDPEELFSFDALPSDQAPARVGVSLDDPPGLTERPAPRRIPGRGRPRPDARAERGPARLSGRAQRTESDLDDPVPDRAVGLGGRQGRDVGSLDLRSGGHEPGGAGPAGRRSSGVIRTLTGIGVAALLLIALKVGPAAALALVILLVTMAAAELYGVLRKAGYQPATLVGLVATICLMVAVYLKGEAAIGIVVVLTVAVCLIWYLGIERARSTANLAATVLGFFWVGLLGSFAALLLSPALFPHRHGEAFFLGAVIATVAYDVGALVVGARLGRRPLAPAVSPAKTWEGMFGGIAVCLIVSAVIVGRIHPWGTASAIGLAVVVCVLAPLGDLCESVVKRDLEVKDMGSILPGHGGVLDRIDALLFTIPGAYYLVRLAHLGA